MYYIVEIYEVARAKGHLPTPDRYRARILTGGGAPGTYRRTLGTPSEKRLHQRMGECGGDRNIRMMRFTSDAEALAEMRALTRYLNQS